MSWSRYFVLISLITHNVCFPDWVQVGGVFCVLQVGQSGAEVIINSLSAVVVPLHVQQMGDHMNSCRDTERRHVTAAVFEPVALKNEQPCTLKNVEFTMFAVAALEDKISSHLLTR